jgi:hypothetical protein
LENKLESSYLSIFIQQQEIACPDLISLIASHSAGPLTPT